MTNLEYYEKIFKLPEEEKDVSINFHNHTLFSDGKDSVEEILQQAKKTRITHLSITDHDTLDAYLKGNALSKAKEKGINLIPGVEVTVKTTEDVKFQVHMLLYFSEKLLENKEFIEDFQEKIGKNRGINLLKRRIEAINKHFGEKGIHLKMEDFEGIGLNFNTITTAHSALAIEKKYPNLSEEEKQKIIGKKSPAYIKAGTDIEILMDFVKKYDDIIPVMAHPIRKKEIEYSDKIIEYIKNLRNRGFLKGLEMWHPELTSESIEKLKKIDIDFYTAGSDTHDINGKRTLLNTLKIGILKEYY